MLFWERVRVLLGWNSRNAWWKTIENLLIFQPGTFDQSHSCTLWQNLPREGSMQWLRTGYFGKPVLGDSRCIHVAFMQPRSTWVGLHEIYILMIYWLNFEEFGSFIFYFFIYKMHMWTIAQRNKSKEPHWANQMVHCSSNREREKSSR